MTHATVSSAWRVLVVDDEENLNWSLLTSLRKDGYQAEGALTGEEAQRRLAAAPYDCVISDVKMPGMDGFELLQWLRQHHPQTRVIMMTAFGSPTARQDALQNGVVAYLEKPFDLRTLKDELRRLATTQAPPATEGYDLIEVARVLNLSKRDIAVQVAGAGIAGMLRFLHGDLVWAESGQLSGNDAFYALCGARASRIEPVAWDGHTTRNVTQTMSQLLFMALAQRESRGQARAGGSHLAHASAAPAPPAPASSADAPSAASESITTTATVIMPAVTVAPTPVPATTGPLDALKSLTEKLPAPCCAVLLRADGTVAARQARHLAELPSGVYAHLAAAAQAASRGALLGDLGTVEDIHIRTSHHTLLVSRLPGAEGTGLLALILPPNADPAAVVPAVRIFMSAAAGIMR